MNAAFLTCALSLCACTLVFAQEHVISGKVTDIRLKDPIPGVSIAVKGVGVGAVTDKNGEYAISVPDSSAVLVFSLAGFKTVKRPASGSLLDVTMAEEVINLSEDATPTAVAIEQEKRLLGYSISQISSKDVTVARETNIVNALQGKATGVLVTQTAGGVGASSQIIVRGMTSLGSSNNPLWVVDGAPIFNEQAETGSRINGNRDFFNGAGVINPDDVESINILKGAAASALYGSRAAAGVIIVTTKKGMVRTDGLNRPQITINSSARFDWLFRAPNMQYEYSAGRGGKYDSLAVTSAWGAPIRGQEVTLPITLMRGPLQAHKENYNDVYKMGKTLINNVSISDSNDKFDYRFSATSLNQDGILPNSALNRLTASLNAGVKHAKWMTTRFSIQYVRTDIPNKGVMGINDPNVIAWNSFTPTANFGLFRAMPWKNELGQQVNIQQAIGADSTNNPLWLRFENQSSDLNDRLITSLTQVFTPTAGLNITSRIGYDFEVDKRLFSNSTGTIGIRKGSFVVDAIDRRQLNWDGFVDYTRQIGDVMLKGLAGFNYNSRIFERESLNSSDLSLPGVLNPSSTRNNTPARDYWETELLGAYFQIDASYKNWLSLSVTGRNDWSSTLPKNNNSYFYPSVSAAFVFTEALGIASRGLSFGKLRANWAQVGNMVRPYQLDLVYYLQNNQLGPNGLTVNPSSFGTTALAKSNAAPRLSLQPEQQSGWEVGAELAFLDGRIGLDITYYSSENRNQLITAPVAHSTGFNSAAFNSGSVISSGVEATLRATVMDVGRFQWNTAINFSTNEVKVYDLGINQFVLENATGGVRVAAVNKSSIELQGIGWARDPASGRPLIDPKTGRRLAGEVKSFGSIIPIAAWGFTNVFSIGGLTLSATIDGRIGGKIYSGSIQNLWHGGFTAETVGNRQGAYVDRDGLIQGENGAVRENDVPVRSSEDLWKRTTNDNGVIAEAAVFDGTFIKLREVGLSYSLPKRWLSKTPFTGIRIGVEGRNLLLIYSKVPHIDPEVNSLGSGFYGFGVEYNSIPSARSLGFNVELKF